MQYSYEKTSDTQTLDARIQVWTGSDYEVKLTLGDWYTRVHIWRAPGVEYSPDIPTISVRGDAKNTPLQMDICPGCKTVLYEEVSTARKALEHQLEIIKGIQDIFIEPLNKGTFDFEASEVSCQVQDALAKYLVIINYTFCDEFDERYTSAHTYVAVPPDWVDSNEEDHWLRFFRETVSDFLNTPEGKQAWEDTLHDFSWTDIEDYIPEEFLSRHGIKTYQPGGRLEISGVITLEVNKDDSFDVPDEDE